MRRKERHEQEEPVDLGPSRQERNLVAQPEAHEIGERLGARVARGPDHFVSLAEQQLRQVGAVLSRDASDERASFLFAHSLVPLNRV